MQAILAETILMVTILFFYALHSALICVNTDHM